MHHPAGIHLQSISHRVHPLPPPQLVSQSAAEWVKCLPLNICPLFRLCVQLVTRRQNAQLELHLAVHLQHWRPAGAAAATDPHQSVMLQSCCSQSVMLQSVMVAPRWHHKQTVKGKCDITSKQMVEDLHGSPGSGD